MTTTATAPRTDTSDRALTRLLDAWLDHMNDRRDLDDTDAAAIAAAISRRLSLRDAILLASSTPATRDDLVTIAIHAGTPAAKATVTRLLADAFDLRRRDELPDRDIQDRAAWACRQLKAIAGRTGGLPKVTAATQATWGYIEWIGLGHEAKARGLALQAATNDPELRLARILIVAPAAARR